MRRTRHKQAREAAWQWERRGFGLEVIAESIDPAESEPVFVLSGLCMALASVYARIARFDLAEYEGERLARRLERAYLGRLGSLSDRQKEGVLWATRDRGERPSGEDSTFFLR